MTKHISAKVLADSITPDGKRLTTFEIKVPRIILAEFNTHRCLDYDTELEFDMPSKSNKGYRRVEKIKIGEFCEKWNNGGKERKMMSTSHFDCSSVDDNTIYSPAELTAITGMSKPAINFACRTGELPFETTERHANGSAYYLIRGCDFKKWRLTKETKTFKQNLRPRLSKMLLRAYNEDTGKIEHVHVTDCWFVGRRKTLKLSVGDKTIVATPDHLFYTNNGWKELQDIKVGIDKVLITTCKKGEGYTTKNTQKYDGKFVQSWNRQIKNFVIERQHGVCADCGEPSDNYEIHHVLPRYQRPDLVFDINNVVALCPQCHKKRHKVQGWQVGQELSAQFYTVFSITEGNEVDVFDLSVDSQYHNFFANGILVHNCLSRNFASSRAIPVKKLRAEVWNDPFMPVYWGANKSGMSASEELTGWKLKLARLTWRLLSKVAVLGSWTFEKVGLHKQTANRILEPWLSVTGVVSATEWDNFFALRLAPSAQPEIQALARCMKEAMDASTPVELQEGEAHLPYIDDEEKTKYNILDLVKISTARCCRVSYNNMLGKKSQPEEDIKLHDRLATDHHMSPLEHVAFVPTDACTRAFLAKSQRNLRGWVQYRALVEDGTLEKFKTLLGEEEGVTK